MSPQLAQLLGLAFVGTILWIEYRHNREAPIGLWLPTLWMAICGSRAIGSWSMSVDASMDYESGSSVDRLVLSGMIVMAALVLSRRKVPWSHVIRDNKWLLVFFLYAGVSTLWSEVAFISFKRWFRLTGQLLVALVVLTDAQPLRAFEAVFRRVAYVLVPSSLVLIKYLPDLGVRYGRWDGQQMWTGVTTHKNMLGQLCAVSVFVLVWSLYRNWQSKEPWLRLRRLADFSVIAIALLLLRGPAGSYSATSIAILTIGLFLMFALYRHQFFGSFMTGHMKLVVVGLGLVYVLFSQGLIGTATSMLGRDSTLTGRTEIWAYLLETANQHPIFGVGYGGFWGRAENDSAIGVSEGHNGYLDVYLELGSVGLVLLVLFVMSVCNKVRSSATQSMDASLLGLCFLLMLLMYNFTESAMLSTGYLWTTVFVVAVVMSAQYEALARASNGAPTLIQAGDGSPATSRYRRPETAWTRAARTQQTVRFQRPGSPVAGSQRISTNRWSK